MLHLLLLSKVSFLSAVNLNNLKCKNATINSCWECESSSQKEKHNFNWIYCLWCRKRERFKNPSDIVTFYYFIYKIFGMLLDRHIERYVMDSNSSEMEHLWHIKKSERCLYNLYIVLLCLLILCSLIFLNSPYFHLHMFSIP